MRRGPGLVEQGRALQSALTTADDQHPAATEDGQVLVLGGVRDEAGGPAAVQRRNAKEGRDPAGDHEPVDGRLGIVGQAEPELAVLPAHRASAARVELGYEALLEPLPVLEE